MVGCSLLVVGCLPWVAIEFRVLLLLCAVCGI